MILYLEQKCPILKKKGRKQLRFKTCKPHWQPYRYFLFQLYLKGGDGVQNTKTPNPCSKVFTI